jgi:hypothetical protein
MDEQNAPDELKPMAEFEPQPTAVDAVAGNDVDDALALIFGTSKPAAAVPKPETIPADELEAPLSNKKPDDRDEYSEFDEGVPQKQPLWPLVFTALIVFIVVTGSLTFYLRTAMAHQAAELAAIKADGDSRLNESISLIQEADAVVIAFDAASENQVTEESLPQLEALLDQIPTTAETLDNAIDKAELAQSIYTTDEDRQLAQYAIEAANARTDMLDLNSQLTTYDIAAMQCAIYFNQAWDLIFAADTDMRSAVEVVNEGGNGAVSEAVEFNRAAQDKIIQAEAAIAAASQLFPEVDFSTITNYLTAKKESVALAIASDEALLDDDVDYANSLNDEFVAKDGEAVELAGLIPEDPTSLIVSAYDTATRDLKAAYREARDRAADADAFLRAYVGVDVLTPDTPASDTPTLEAPTPNTPALDAPASP